MGNLGTSVRLAAVCSIMHTVGEIELLVSDRSVVAA